MRFWLFLPLDMSNQEINVGNQTSLNVHLILATSNLNQVVVVGYGTQKKMDVTGAIGYMLKVTNLSKQPVLTATQAIAGSGCRRSGNQQWTAGKFASGSIRGSGSILAGGNPLYIVDGIMD